MEKRKSKIASSAVKNVAKKPKHAKNLKALKSRKIMVSNDQSQEVMKEKRKKSRVPESCRKNSVKKTRVVSAVVPSKTAPKLPIKKAATSKGKAVATVKGKAKSAIVKVDKSVKSKSKKEVNSKSKSKKKSDARNPAVAKSKLRRNPMP